MAYGLTTEKNAVNFDVGAGEFSFRNFDKDVNPHNTFMSLGNCSAATCTWNINKIEKRDATRGSRRIIATAETQRDASLSITMDESDPIKYAMALYGQAVIKEIKEQEVEQIFTVSPGDEIFLLTDDGSTAAYNYEDLKVEYVYPPASLIHQPVLYKQGGMSLSTGTVASTGNYTGSDEATYYVKISKANSVPGTVTDAEFIWKTGLAGAYSSSPVTVTGLPQLLADGVSVTLTAGASGQDFEVGDEWVIEAIPAGANLVFKEDYTADKVDVKNGKVRFPADSRIGFDTLVKVSCHVPQQYIPRVYAGMLKQIEGELRFEYDPTYGRHKAYTFYHVSISPSGDDSLITEDWSSRQITATVIADYRKADPDSPESVYFRVDHPGDVTAIMTERT